jgi:hypothetical protein
LGQLGKWLKQGGSSVGFYLAGRNALACHRQQWRSQKRMDNLTQAAFLHLIFILTPAKTNDA